MRNTSKDVRYVVIDTTAEGNEVFIDKHGENTDMLEDARLFRTTTRANSFAEEIPDGSGRWWKVATLEEAYEIYDEINQQIAA